MKPTDLYMNVVASLQKFIVDFIANETPGAVYFDWDAHAQASEMPSEGMLVGPAGCGMTKDEVGYEIVFSFGISTITDTNLFKLRRAISTLFGLLQPETKLPVYDQQLAQIASWMVVKTPVQVAPVTNAEVRSLQFVTVTAAMDPGATSSLR